MSNTATSPVSSFVNVHTTQAPALPDLAGLPDRPLDDGQGNVSLYGSLSSATAVLPKNGTHFVLSTKKNNTKGAGVEDGWEIHTVIPGFGADIGSLGMWSDVVNSVLVQQAKESLKQYRTNNPAATQIPLALFTAAQLREDYLSGGASGAMTKEELDKAFSNSATWKRIIGSDSFKHNSQYRVVADRFKTMVVSLAGRSHGSLQDSDLNKIMAKLEESDFVTPFGAYVIRRIQQIQKARENDEVAAFDIDAL